MGLHLENEVAVVKTPTIISNNPVEGQIEIDGVSGSGKMFLITKIWCHSLDDVVSINIASSSKVT